MSGSTELEAVKNLQATNKIISILEKSKNFIEDWADRNPECLIVFESSGRIVKANKLALKMLEAQEKNYLDEYIYKMMDKTSQNIMQTCMNELIKKGDDDPIDIELILKNSSGSFVFQCSLSLLSSKIFQNSPLFTFSGRDLTKIREYEKTLTEIFNNIPLGIVTISKEGRIRQPYSKYSEYLLQDPNRGSSLKDRDYYECIFAPAEDFLSNQDLSMAKLLLTCIGEPRYIFENISLSFPKYIMRCIDKSNITLCLTYHPIVRNGIDVEEVMVIIEDVTVQNGKNIERLRNKEVAIVNYVLSLQGADQNYLKEAFSYIAGHLVAIDQYFSEEHLPGILEIYQEIASELESAKLTDLSLKIKDFINDLGGKNNMSEVFADPELMEAHVCLRSELYHLEKYFHAIVIASSDKK